MWSQGRSHLFDPSNCHKFRLPPLWESVFQKSKYRGHETCGQQRKRHSPNLWSSQHLFPGPSTWDEECNSESRAKTLKALGRTTWMKKVGERVWGEIVMTWKPLLLLGETVGISWPLEVISLLYLDLLLGSHSVSDSIQGTVSEVNCGMCWVQNTNMSVEATLPDFREL